MYSTLLNVLSYIESADTPQTLDKETSLKKRNFVFHYCSLYFADVAAE